MFSEERATPLVDTAPTSVYVRLLEKHLATGLWVLLFGVLAGINSTSVLMEYARRGHAIEPWEPFTWEYTSAAGMLLLIPLILYAERRWPFTRDSWKAAATVHVGATVPFSLLHVGTMVGLRKMIYALQGRIYDFGNVPVEMLYEYRKDFVSYFFILGIVYAWRAIRQRQSGATYESVAKAEREARFLVRHRGRVSRVAAPEIDWVEAAGNYVLLHAGNRIHPLRDTMKEIETRLGPGFCRVHRSTIVNLSRIDRTASAPGGELYVTLDDGQELKCGRSYQDGLLRALEAGRGLSE